MSYRLVIDSSLVDWSADLPEEAPDEDLESQCDARKVMNSIFDRGYHLSLSEDLYGEICEQVYNQKKPEYESRQWPRVWLLLMQERNRIEDTKVPYQNTLQGAQMCGEMVKDAHLVESALSSDGRVISRDESILACWVGLCHKNPPVAIVAAHPRISSIVWADPQIHGEDVVWWLEGGALEIKKWRLDSQPELEHHCHDYRTDRCILDNGKSGEDTH